MTFMHKLSCRLALLKDRVVAVSPVLLAAAVVFACERPVQLTDTGSGTVAQLLVYPKSMTVRTGQTADFMAVALTSTGDTAVAAVTWSATIGSITDTSTKGGRHYGKFKAGSDTGRVKVIARGQGNNLADTATVAVTLPPVASVSVSPASATVLPTQTVQLTATTLDSTGTVLTGRTVTWSSSSTGVATVNGSGLVTGVAVGSTTVTAASEGRSASSSVTVTTVPVASVTVTPASGSLYVGQTVQLTATPKDSAGNPLTGRVIAWSSDNTTVATVSTSGLVTGKGAGSATITAATGGKSGTSTITAAIVPVASVVVSPASASVATGNTVQLTATPKDSVGNTLTGRTITWSSSATSVASVSSSGLVTGVTIGSATITAATGGKSGSSAITVTAPPPPGTHTGWYAAPNGSSSGDGSSGRPWNLPTALSGGNGKVQPGDTVWLRGGTYAGQFRSTLTGTAAAPIVVRQYPGERAIIDGGGSTSDTFVADGSYSVFWGFEMTNSDPARCCSTSSFFRADMMVSHATHVKFINMIVHDGGPGYYTWSPYGDVEIYGAIIYNIGYDGSDRGHGHGMYLKNDVGPLVVRDNILFNSYGYGIHAYTNTGDGLLNGIHLEGNVSFNSGTLSAQGTSGNIGNLGQPPANNMAMIDNMTYFSPGIGGSNWLLGSGDGLTATGNYVVGGTGMSQGTWTNAVITGNTVITSGTKPTQPLVFVRPNAYEPGRAAVIIYNWSRQASVSVDLSSVLSVGRRYEVRNVQDLFGAPLVSGTFGGGTISFPMAGITPPTPVGLTSSPAPVTGPDFNVFLVTTLP
ncbi:MAG: hypothetical protein DMD50_07605 [Gemmatimonadetes bacterium]|nr:MAG: hypothetical protein DMD50_07605 [Gemmatimonadota bacterium]